MSSSCLACPFGRGFVEQRVADQPYFGFLQLGCRNRFVLQALQFLANELHRFDDALRATR